MSVLCDGVTAGAFMGHTDPPALGHGPGVLLRIADSSRLKGRRQTMKLSDIVLTPEMSPFSSEGSEGPMVEGYDQLEIVGNGSTSVVHRAICHKDGKEVVMKCMRRGGEDIAGLARQEYDLIRSLDHPHIIKAFDFIYSAGDERTTIVLEYVKGSTLTKAVKYAPERRLSPEVSLRLFVKLLSAIEYLHAKGIAHRDVKADNLLISSNLNDLKLTDFNTSCNIDEALTPTGTPEYASPEVERASTSC
mmetsp:Transcript_34972/g.96704  ORF Transcript_34972/g.96704 Transcript_34972/m.96704 type:complete len:247 (-) Transcript_34972:228-968(-)